MRPSLAAAIALSFGLLPMAAVAQPGGEQPLKLLKVDPPNWFAALPKPMLLVRGENLTGSTFTLSDASLRIDKAVTSDSGHWTELWLAASPAKAETIQIAATHGGQHAAVSYTFKAPRDSGSGMAGFSSSDVMYLIMTDRFADGDLTNDGPDGHSSFTSAEAKAERDKPRGWHGGDLRGIADHLDYLQQLGITTVWVTPVQQNHEPQSYHGYGATDLYAVDEHFGSLDDLRNLVAALHARHMKFVLDTVPNHVGPAHPWVRDSPDPTWFHGTLVQHTVAQGEFAPLVDPHAPWRDQRDVTQGWFANVLPDLNQEDPAVAQYLIQNSIWWIEETGIDGLRIDTFPYVGRTFWHSFHEELHALFPQLTTVGEIFNGDPDITSSFAGGVTRTGVDTGLDTPFDFPTYFALRNVFLKSHPMSELAEVLRHDNLFPHPERLVPFLGNHDTTRFMTDAAATPKELALAFTVLATMRGMPQLYSGDEIAMRGGDDPDNRRDFPGGFGTAQGSAFTPAARSAEQQTAFEMVQRLLAIRCNHPALQRGEEQVLEAGSDTMVYVRTLQQPGAQPQDILIAVNKSKQSQRIVIETAATAVEGLQHAKPLLGAANAISFGGDTISLDLESESAAIFELR